MPAAAAQIGAPPGGGEVDAGVQLPYLVERVEPHAEVAGLPARRPASAASRRARTHRPAAVGQRADLGRDPVALGLQLLVARPRSRPAPPRPPAAPSSRWATTRGDLALGPGRLGLGRGGLAQRRIRLPRAWSAARLRRGLDVLAVFAAGPRATVCRRAPPVCCRRRAPGRSGRRRSRPGRSTLSSASMPATSRPMYALAANCAISSRVCSTRPLGRVERPVGRGEVAGRLLGAVAALLAFASAAARTPRASASRRCTAGRRRLASSNDARRGRDPLRGRLEGGPGPGELAVDPGLVVVRVRGRRRGRERAGPGPRRPPRRTRRDRTRRALMTVTAVPPASTAAGSRQYPLATLAITLRQSRPPNTDLRSTAGPGLPGTSQRARGLGRQRGRRGVRRGCRSAARTSR